MKVEYRKSFKHDFGTLHKDAQDEILDFIIHVEAKGFVGLPGLRKSSDDVDTDNRNFMRDVKFAIKHKLWHYHIGIPFYKKTKGFGFYTSKFVLHYQDHGDTISLVKYDSHPPFSLPEDYQLESL